MQRDLKNLLKEKWFLVAADFIAVLGILCVGFNPKDGWEATLAFLGIMGAGLIVVVPVMLDQGSKAERLAEQARLRAALAAEIDQVRDNARALSESLTRRVADAELTQQKAIEGAVTNLAQKASMEINALKATVAELEKKLLAAEKTAKVGQDALEAHELMTEKLEALAASLRETVGEVDELAESVEAVKATQTEAMTAAQAVGQDLKEDFKKSSSRTERSLAKLEEQLEKLQAEVQELRERKPTIIVETPGEKAVETTPEPTVAPAHEAPVVAPETTEESVEKPARASRPRAKKKTEELLEEELPMESNDELALSESPESSAPGGGTALIINLMIGIGNKPFVRGTGPGLSPDKGVPMDFIGIGRWQWVSPQPEAPATVEVWKNDQTPLGEPLHLSGGEPVEVDEGHFTGG